MTNKIKMCKCGCTTTQVFYLDNNIYCNACIDRHAAIITITQNYEELVNLLNSEVVTSLGFTRADLLGADSGTNSFEVGHFDLVGNEKLKARVKGNKLLLDLWFQWELTDPVNVIEEKVIDGQLLVKQTVQITEIDYIGVNGKRHYWNE